MKNHMAPAAYPTGFFSHLQWSSDHRWSMGWQRHIYIYIHIYICPLVSRPDSGKASISMVKYGNIIDWGWFVPCWKYWTTTFSPIVTNAFRHLNHLGSGNTEASCFFCCSKNFMSRRTSKELPIFELPSDNQLVGGLDHLDYFSIQLGIIIPTDCHIFQRGSNH
jgi:hypothetical protein